MLVLENLGADVSAGAPTAKWGNLYDLYLPLPRPSHRSCRPQQSRTSTHSRLVGGLPKSLRFIDFEAGKANAGEGETKAEMHKLLRCLGLNPNRFRGS
ncbi:hypothetical protein B0H14DRAFT_3867823 [Mycena olivaceomarginata]|nr:hypothetical protein B0H14DRAFT_3867823 [Mycena olivaceomarginata]